VTPGIRNDDVAVWLFYAWTPGPGWSGRVGPLLWLPIFLTLFSAQIVFSRLGLRRYRFGPAEWLWRSLTHGRLHPMRLREAARARELYGRSDSARDLGREDPRSYYQYRDAPEPIYPQIRQFLDELGKCRGR